MGSLFLLSSTRLRTLSRNQFLILRSVMKGGELGEDMLEIQVCIGFHVCFARNCESIEVKVATASCLSRIRAPKTRQRALFSKMRMGIWRRALRLSSSTVCFHDFFPRPVVRTYHIQSKFDYEMSLTMFNRPRRAQQQAPRQIS